MVPDVSSLQSSLPKDAYSIPTYLLVLSLGSERTTQQLGNLCDLVKIAQRASFRSVYCHRYACCISNRGGSHDIYPKSRRCPVV